jgi:phosphohistidine phosphatase
LRYFNDLSELRTGGNTFRSPKRKKLSCFLSQCQRNAKIQLVPFHLMTINPRIHFMKTLLLMRHAKAVECNNEAHDHARALQSRGKRDAEKIGHHLKQERLVPDLILCSDAKRCRRTAEKVAEALHFHGETHLTGELYLANKQAYWHVLQQVNDSCHCVLMVGHNPGIEEWLEALTGNYTPMCTGSLAVVEFALLEKWSDLTSKPTGHLLNFWQPQAIA